MLASRAGMVAGAGGRSRKMGALERAWGICVARSVANLGCLVGLKGEMQVAQEPKSIRLPAPWSIIANSQVQVPGTGTRTCTAQMHFRLPPKRLCVTFSRLCVTSFTFGSLQKYRVTSGLDHCLTPPRARWHAPRARATARKPSRTPLSGGGEKRSP